MASKYDGRQASITFTVTREMTLTDDFTEVAKMLGVAPAKLEKIIKGESDDWEPADKVWTSLERNADTDSEQFTVDIVEEV